MYYLGIDLHKDESHVAVLHDDAGVVGDQLMKSFLSIIDELTSQIEETAASPRETQLLMTIPGVNFYSSLLITSEIGEIDRFDEAKQVVSDAGLDPVVRESVQPAAVAYESGTPTPFISIVQRRFNSSSRTCLIQSQKVNVNVVGRLRPPQ